MKSGATLRAILLTAAIACAQGPPPSQPAPTETYVNTRFGYVVEYPKTLVPQGEAENGDGQRFVSKDKTFTLTVWGIHNVMENTVKAECEQRIRFEQQHHPFTVSYKVVRDGWFAFSGAAGPTILYQKAFLQDGVFKTVQLEYPVAQKDPLDSVVTQIVASFRAATQ